MKFIYVLLLLFVFSVLTAQSSGDMKLELANLNCQQYRDIIDENISLLELNDLGKLMILGKNGKYYKSGMSKHFISEPQVVKVNPNYPPRNPYIVAIEQAHVDLYHCDIKELAILESIKLSINKNTINPSSNHIKIYPNPSNGVVKIYNPGKEIDRIELFDVSGSLIKVFTSNFETLNISMESSGFYYLKIYQNEEMFVNKIFLN